MLKIKVTEKSGKSKTYQGTSELVDRLSSMGHGLPERPELDEMGQPTGVILPAEYTIEIIDLDQDPEYLLQQCHAKRQAEYPSLGEFADAFVKMQNGDASQMEVYVAACLAVKAKYPKP